jgi:two-component system LytT family sensor kinase
LRFNFQGRYIFDILFWIVYAAFMILETQGYTMKRGIAFTLMPLALYFILMALLVYGNTMFLIPLLLEKKKRSSYALGLVLFIAAYTYFRSLNQQYWDAKVWPEDVMNLSSYLHWNFLYAVWFLLISSMLFFTQKWSDQRQQVKNIQINQLQTELKYLRSQVNPHFLFNGLNTIYGNIDSSNQQARNILLQFSDLLRYNLYEADTDQIDLEKELVHLRNYVELQKARSNENLQVSLQTDIENGHTHVAPLLFIPFVENAFKFGTQNEKNENKIEIVLIQKGRNIFFSCVNSFEDLPPSSGGIGITNVKRRLELLYKGRYELNIHSANNIYSVQLTIGI